MPNAQNDENAAFEINIYGILMVPAPFPSAYAVFSNGAKITNI